MRVLLSWAADDNNDGSGGGTAAAGGASCAQTSDGGNPRVSSLSMVVLLDHIDVDVVINGTTRCLTSMTMEGEQSNDIAGAVPPTTTTTL
jgi:hypothetical protein